MKFFLEDGLKPSINSTHNYLLNIPRVYVYTDEALLKFLKVPLKIFDKVK